MRPTLLAIAFVLAALPGPASRLLPFGPRAAEAQVDAVVDSLIITPSTAVVGQPVTLRAVIRNAGTTTLINNFWSEFLTSVGGTRTRIAEILVSQDIGAGLSTSVTYTWTASPVDSVIFVADNRKWVPETNENNNSLAKPVVIARPDFKVTSVRFSPPEQIVGRSQSLLATLTNLGAATNDSVDVCFTVNGAFAGCDTVPPVVQGDTVLVAVPGWTATTGTLILRAVADSARVWNESNETNNAFLDTVTVPLADLYVRDIFWSPPSPGIGDSTTIYAEIANRGEGSFAGPFSVRFDVDGAWTTQTVNDDLGLAERGSAFSNSAFESGGFGTWAVSTGWTVTAHPGDPDSTGNRYYARALAGGATLESTPFVVTESTLLFRGRSQVQVFPGTLEVRIPGGAVLASTSFGSGAGDSWQAYLVDLNDHVGQTVIVRVTTQGGGASVDDIRMPRTPGNPLLVAFPRHVWYSTAGNHMFKITVDSGNSVPEATETNNERSEILLRGPGDYVLTGLQASPREPVIGRSTGLVATVTNMGFAQGTPSDVCFTVDGVLVGCAPMSGLDQGASAEVRIEGWIPTAGSHSLYAVADAYGVIVETDETNNGQDGTASVLLPDLAVRDLRWLPANPADGDSVTVLAEIENLGVGGTVASYHVTLSSTLGDSTVLVYDDVALGRRAHVFPNADFETGTLAGWNPSPYWRIISTPGDSVVTANRFCAHTDSSNTVLASLPFLVTANTLSFRGATAFNSREATFEVRRTNGNLLSSLEFSGTSPMGWDWQAHAVDLSNYLGDSVVVRVVSNFGGARVDDLRLGDNPAGTQVVSFPSWRWAVSSGAPALTVTVDALGEIAESQESNNTYTENLMPGLADYMVTGFRLSPDRQAAGAYQGFLVRVRNGGALTTRTSKLCFEVDGAPVGCMDVPGLDSGEERELLFSGWVCVPGSHALTVIADGLAEIAEGNEQNNFLSTVLHIPLPDLHVRNIFWTPANPDSGDTVAIYAEIENLGVGGNVANYQVHIRVNSTNNSVTVRDDVGIGQQDPAFGNAGLESGSWAGWSAFAGWSMGSHTTHPTAGDNRIYAASTSGANVLQSAPFVVTDSTLSFRGATAFSIWPATFTVHRVGGAPLASTSFASTQSGIWDWRALALDVSSALGDSVYVRVVSASGGTRIDDVRMGTDPIALSVVTVVKSSWVATVGSHVVTCLVDVGDQVPEVSESNNTLTVPLINAFSLCPPPVTEVTPGDTVEVPLRIYGAQIPSLQNLGLDLEYDATDLQLLAVLPGPATQGWSIGQLTIGSGQIRITMSGPTPLSPPPGTDLLRIRFVTAPYGFGNAGISMEAPTGDLASALLCNGNVRFIGDVSAVPDEGGFAPALGAAFPNPFRSGTALPFTVAPDAPGRVVLAVYNIQGQLVRTLVDAEVPAGAHVAEWQADSDRGDSVAPGIYFAVMRQGAQRVVRKMVFVR